jgi:hypothetical protein
VSGVRIRARRGANHGLHLVFSLLTCGLWAVTGWPVAAVLGRRRTVVLPDLTANPQMHGMQSYYGTHYWNAHTNRWEQRT